MKEDQPTPGEAFVDAWIATKHGLKHGGIQHGVVDRLIRDRVPLKAGATPMLCLIHQEPFREGETVATRAVWIDLRSPSNVELTTDVIDCGY